MSKSLIFLLVLVKFSSAALANDTKRYKPGDTFKDCDACPEMVVIPPGSFRMGNLSGVGADDEQPVHEVKIGYRFAVGKYEVTQDEWKSIMNTNPSEFKSGRNPVENVSWDDAKEFVKKLSTKTGKGYRLLSESEWEYVARAGSTAKFPWGNEINATKAKFYDGKKLTSPVPVGSYGANAFGLHDTAGNVYEWPEDCYNENYNGAPSDGRAWTNVGTCSQRVLRGGSWNTESWYLRSAFRIGYYSTYRLYYIGFRVARALSH